MNTNVDLPEVEELEFDRPGVARFLLQEQQQAVNEHRIAQVEVEIEGGELDETAQKRLEEIKAYREEIAELDPSLTLPSLDLTDAIRLRAARDYLTRLCNTFAIFQTRYKVAKRLERKNEMEQAVKQMEEWQGKIDTCRAYIEGLADEAVPAKVLAPKRKKAA